MESSDEGTGVCNDNDESDGGESDPHDRDHGSEVVAPQAATIA